MNGTYSAGARTTTVTPAKTLATLVFALLVSTILMALPQNAATALAAEDITVALTVVDTSNPDNPAVCNEKVLGLTDENTVADLLAAAGFKEGTQEESAADPSVYFVSYDAPYFLGKAYDADTGCYWATMFNGSSDNYASAMLKMNGEDVLLQDGGHYQYVYTTWDITVFEYSVDIPDPLIEVIPPDDGNVPDLERFSQLCDNLSLRFAMGGTDGSITNNTVRAALALNYWVDWYRIDADAIAANLAAAEASDPYFSAGTLSKYILALAAAGVDCTAATIDGVERNLVTEMEAGIEGSGVYAAAYMLPVYQYGPYEPSSDEAIQTLIAEILAGQGESGLFGAAGFEDAQTTAQAILALAPYTEANEHVSAGMTADVKEATEKGLEAILAMETIDGGFSGYMGTADVDTTADVCAALLAYGISPWDGEEVTTENGSTPIGYLIAMADEDLAGYNDCGSWDETLTASTALFGLAAGDVTLFDKDAYSMYDRKVVPQRFDDVNYNYGGTPDRDWFAEWVDKVSLLGLMSGYTDADGNLTGLFGPNDSVSRGQVATILYRATYPERTDTRVPADYADNTTDFTDNEPFQFYTAAMNWAKEEGIFTGDASTDFTTVRPNDTISRQELSLVLMRWALANGGPTLVNPDCYADAPDAASVADWATEGIAWCYEKGVMTGAADTGALDPLGNASRAAMAKMIVVTYGTIPVNDDSLT